MQRDTLLDFFDDRIQSSKTFLQYDDGYRLYTYSYLEVRDAATALATRLRESGLTPSAKVVVWGENRPEWIVALWGCLLARTVVVPVDYRTSPDLVSRIIDIVDARLVMVGQDVAVSDLESGVTRWSLTDLLSSTSAQPIDDDAPGVTDPPSSSGHANEDLAEIIFTSGATADPKGVTLTHRNILANIVPVEREISKYRRYARPFYPLRFLNLLPLSHMFGQAMATFIPPMLDGVTIFMPSLNPSDIVHQIRTRRISVLICVPKMLEVLRDYIVSIAPETLDEPSSHQHVALRWWRYRRVHRLFGLKFWSFVVGAAPLDPELEAFWSRLGFLVIQGYGLTETAPIVTLNHPFRTRRGSVGTPIGGVEVRIASDGEILVRGDNVTSGYYNAPQETAAAFDDGWFHTGDIGSVDESGRLSVQGRKKEMIVTPEGLNVFPEDIERVLLGVDGVRDAAVVAASSAGNERVHAVLVLDDGGDPKTVVRDANPQLEDHQRIRGLSLWPEATLPRTDGTQKLKRREIRQWVETGNAPRGTQAARDTSLLGIVRQFAVGHDLALTTTVESLGLTSIERIELMMALERERGAQIDESAFNTATTLADLDALLESQPARALSPGHEHGGVAAPVSPHDDRPDASMFPAWNQSRIAKRVRWFGLATVLLPLTRHVASITVEGLDRVSTIDTPVVYAANHQSHMDAPVILAALPAACRHNVATAAAKEWFGAHFHPAGYSRWKRLTNSLNYYLSSLFFNVFPLPQREAGTREAIRYLGRLLGNGTSVLIFPEGRRTDDGRIDPFQPGIGMIGSRLRVPVVPVRIEGVDRILHHTWRMARRGQARVAFGEPLYLEGENYRELARRVEEAVRAL